MTWTDFVLQWSAAEMMAWTGAPKRTVYDWRSGAMPPLWLQPILAAHVTRQMKMHNKTPLATDTSRLAVGRKRKLKGG